MSEIVWKASFMALNEEERRKRETELYRELTCYHGEPPMRSDAAEPADYAWKLHILLEGAKSRHEVERLEMSTLLHGDSYSDDQLRHLELWNRINRYARACGGDPSKATDEAAISDVMEAIELVEYRQWKHTADGW